MQNTVSWSKEIFMASISLSLSGVLAEIWGRKEKEKEEEFQCSAALHVL